MSNIISVTVCSIVFIIFIYKAKDGYVINIGQQIFWIVVLLLIETLFHNYSFLFQYLPNKEEYVPEQATIENIGSPQRRYTGRGRISVIYKGETFGISGIPIGCSEKVGERINVGIKPGKRPTAVRTEISVSSRMLIVLTALFWMVVFYFVNETRRE